MIAVPTAIPEGPPSFRELDRDTAVRAFDALAEALRPERAVPRLLAHYDKYGRYAGKTFVEMLAGPGTAPDDWTATDHYAVTLLSVPPPKPHIARAFLDAGPARNRLLHALGPGLGPENDIAMADNETLLAMERLYLLVRSTLGKSPWVTASKLCARKRPGLFPVRDNLTSRLLGFGRPDYEVEWQLYRLLMLPESGVVDALDALVAEARRADAADTTGHLELDCHPLRWLDAALWMHAKNGEAAVAPISPRP